MRQHPIGTGPFKFVEFNPEPGYQGDAQPGLLEAGPALSRRHRVYDHSRPGDGEPGLCFRQVRHDLPLYADGAAVRRTCTSQMPEAVCELAPTASTATCSSTVHKPPFDNPELRQAMALSIDRQAFVEFSTQGRGTIGGVLQPPPGGPVGHAAGPDAETVAGLWSRCAEESRRGPPDHAKARLWAGQAARHQGDDP